MPRTGIFATVYDIVARIPPGKVATYGQIARMAGMLRGARVVGFAMRGAPRERNLPCHRVLRADGELAEEHVFGDRGYQRMLLESEGVTFLPDGRVDMARNLWRPDPA